jgi:hypothetical protein
MRTLRIEVRCNAGTGLWVAECPQLAGVRAAADSLEDVISAIYAKLPPEWRLASQQDRRRPQR